ncbi:hypothetical protein CRG98_008919 [Punica granatum]|uniref:Uncharacterized protein n=1 Tax=Punica granatum TaxID=22663 RepID=A0A2I0KS62_PUNGR|nr:hypothetical protein CRG98_008919 [Punica granatum]
MRSGRELQWLTRAMAVSSISILATSRHANMQYYVISEVRGGSRKLARSFTVPMGHLDVAVGGSKMAGSPTDSLGGGKLREEENSPRENLAWKERQGAGVATRHSGS